METQTLQAEVRTERGKGEARKLRAEGLVPAVFYGKGVEDELLSVSPKELRKLLTTEFRRNTMIKLQFAGREELSMVKELQVHPVSQEIEHVDFGAIDPEKPVDTRVALRATGRAAGVVAGGRCVVVFREIPVRGKPADIPAEIVADVTNVELGENIQTKDLVLAAGLTVLMPDTQSLITVGAEKRRGKDEEEEATEATEEAKPEAAAPPS